MKKFYASKTFKLGNHIEIIIKSEYPNSKAYINVNLFTLGTEQSFSFGLTLKKDSTFYSQEFGNFVKNNYQNLFSSSTINGKTLFIEKNTLDDETTFYNY